MAEYEGFEWGFAKDFLPRVSEDRLGGGVPIFYVEFIIPDNAPNLAAQSLIFCNGVGFGLFGGHFFFLQGGQGRGNVVSC